MAWSSSKARVGAKVASGAFNQPNNTIANAIDTGAGIMAKSILRKAEEDRIEEREAKKLAAAEARSIAAAQRKKEEEAKKIQRQANAIATRMGVSPTNTDLRNHITESVYAFGDGAAALLQDDLKEGRLIITSTSFDEEVVKTGASMDLAPPFRMGTNKDGSLRTSLDIGPRVDDLEATGNVEDAMVAEGVKDRFNPQQLNSGETEIVQGTIEGFEVNPTAEKSDIDWVAIGLDPEKVGAIRRLNDSRQQPLDAKNLEMLKSVEKKITDDASVILTQEEAELGRKLATMSIPDLRGVALGSSYSESLRSEAQTILDGKVSAKDASDKSVITNGYLGAGSPAAIISTIDQVKADKRLSDVEKTRLINTLNENSREMIAQAIAARNSTKNQNKSPEVIALEAFQATDKYISMNPGQQAEVIVNFASVFKPTYATVGEAIAAYNTARKLGIGYEDQKSRIEASINEISEGDTQQVFGVDSDGFGAVYFTKSVFNTQTNSVDTTTMDGVSLPKILISMEDYDAKQTASERKSMESGLNNYNNSVASFLKLSATMADIVAIADKNPNVLSWTAGMMKKVSTITGEIDTFASVLNNMDEDSQGNISREAYEQELLKKGLLQRGENLDTVANTDITKAVFSGNNAQLIAARRALEAKLALAPFAVGNAEGTTGTAMSNQDRDLFMKFLTSFRKSDSLDKNFAEYLVNSRDELNTVVMRFRPESAEMNTFKDAYGYYPGKGFAKTLEETVADHPNSARYLKIMQGLEDGSLLGASTSADTTSVTATVSSFIPTLAQFTKDFVNTTPEHLKNAARSQAEALYNLRYPKQSNSGDAQ